MHKRLQSGHLTGQLVSLAVLLASVTLGAAHAGESEAYKHVIKVQTNAAEIIEADVSELQPGEAMSFTTDSGRLVDILQGINGVEIYIDGELIGNAGENELHVANAAMLFERRHTCDGNDAHACEGQHEQILHREVEIHCDSTSGDDCEALTFFDADGNVILEEFGGGSSENVIVMRKKHKEIHVD